MNIYQYKAMPFVFKGIDAKEGIVEGYFAAFNIKDADGDIIVPGAFKKSIEERGPQSSRPRIKWFYNHDPMQVPGVLKELKEDTYGLGYVGKVGTHALGKDFLKMAESGIITEHSHGFRIVSEEKKQDANYIKESHLMEGSSLSAWGANEYTPLTGIKSELKVEQIAERIKRLEKFCRNTDATDECIESLLIEIKQLSQLLITTISRSTTQAEKSLEPEKDDKLDELQIKTIIQLTKEKIKR